MDNIQSNMQNQSVDHRRSIGVLHSIRKNIAHLQKKTKLAVFVIYNSAIADNDNDSPYYSRRAVNASSKLSITSETRNKSPKEPQTLRIKRKVIFFIFYNNCRLIVEQP